MVVGLAPPWRIEPLGPVLASAACTTARPFLLALRQCLEVNSLARLFQLTLGQHLSNRVWRQHGLVVVAWRATTVAPAFAHREGPTRERARWLVMSGRGTFESPISADPQPPSGRMRSSVEIVWKHGPSFCSAERLKQQDGIYHETLVVSSE